MRKNRAFTLIELLILMVAAVLVTVLIFSLLMQSADKSSLNSRKNFAVKNLKITSRSIVMSSNNLTGFSKGFLSYGLQPDTLEANRFLRDKFASLISYSKFLDDEKEFRNFEVLPVKNPSGFVLLNGTQVGFYYLNENCGDVEDSTKACGLVIYDVNGKMKPNKLNKDQFTLNLYRNGIN
ncbi:MAG: type II secretion system protein [Candidatus Gastranaerophilales bacterium]|nr:type II secretion system protein [Candidatus Gastranaerophilales bacterium]